MKWLLAKRATRLFARREPEDPASVVEQIVEKRESEIEEVHSEQQISCWTDNNSLRSKYITALSKDWRRLSRDRITVRKVTIGKVRRSLITDKQGEH